MAEVSLQRALQMAIEHHQAGRLAEAEGIYRQILAQVPDHADALHLLGVLAGQTGHADTAIALIGRAIAVNPGVAQYHGNLGEVYRRSRQLDAALTHFRRALELSPEMAAAHANMGLVLWGMGRADEAIAAFTHLIRLRGPDAQAHNDLGASLHASGRLEDAIAAFLQTIELRPDHAQAHANLGIALRDSGRAAEALAAFDRALALDPGLARTHVNLGALLIDSGQAEAAVASLRRAIELQPDLAEAHFNLGIALYRCNHIDESIGAYRRAVAIAPDHAEAHCGLGVATLVTGEVEQALGHFQHALSLRPDDRIAHSNLVMCAQYCPGVTLAGLACVHAEWDRRHAEPLAASGKTWDVDRDSERRLRLGFVSADFRSHPVGLFLAPVVEKLGAYGGAVVCYYNQAGHDDVTRRLAAAASQWRDVFPLSDEALADRIRADGIDILFDLSGHTEGNRLLVFARRPAPVQIAWIGYPGTTGLTAMDYLIADRFHVPPGSEAHYRETILRMPETSVCFDPPGDAPAVGLLPALAAGYVTFGSFNNLAKLTPEVIALWAEILCRVPGARLVLGTRGLNGSRTRERIHDVFAAAGVDRRQVELQGKIARSAVLAAYNTVDLALDPFPYSGGMTTCEALWMGVPVVTTPGETMAGRHSLSHLSNVGLTEMIASDHRDFVERAVRLAQDLPHLAAIRASLREQMLRSPLCDGERFAHQLMALLRAVWRQGCRR